MIIKNVAIRLRTTKGRCQYKDCKNELSGREGYVQMEFRNSRQAFWGSQPRLNICHSCFKKILENYQEDTKQKDRLKKRYDLMIRKKMLRNL